MVQDIGKCHPQDSNLLRGVPAPLPALPGLFGEALQAIERDGVAVVGAHGPGEGAEDLVGLAAEPGVVADLVDRRRLLITWQLIGAAATTAVAVLVLADRVAVWHIYAWAVVNGLIALLSRPAYKVVLTEVVPPDEVRP